MARTRNDLSQEQADLLLEQHKQELEILSRSMDVEKQRQLNSLSDKIAERKKRKAAALEQRHKAEMSKELMNQQNERRQVQDDKVREKQVSNWNMKCFYGCHIFITMVALRIKVSSTLRQYSLV